MISDYQTGWTFGLLIDIATINDNQNKGKHFNER